LYEEKKRQVPKTTSCIKLFLVFYSISFDILFLFFSLIIILSYLGYHLFNLMNILLFISLSYSYVIINKNLKYNSRFSTKIMLQTSTYTYHLHIERNTEKQQKDMKRIHLYHVQILHLNPKLSKKALELIHSSLNLDGKLKIHASLS